MADFQNVGTFDAGVFTPKLGGIAPSGSSFTMDAAGIASGGAFLTSELEKRDPLIRKPLTSVTYPVLWVQAVPTARPSFRPTLPRAHTRRTCSARLCA